MTPLLTDASEFVTALAILLVAIFATAGAVFAAMVTIFAEVLVFGNPNVRARTARLLHRLADWISVRQEQANGATNNSNNDNANGNNNPSASPPDQKLVAEIATLRRQVADLTALAMLSAEDRVLLQRLRTLTGDLAQSLAQWQKDEALCPELIRLTGELDKKFFDILPQALLPMLEATLEALRKRAAFKREVVQNDLKKLAEVHEQLQKLLADQANAHSPLRLMSEAAETLDKARAVLDPTGGSGQ